MHEAGQVESSRQCLELCEKLILLGLSCQIPFWDFFPLPGQFLLVLQASSLEKKSILIPQASGPAMPCLHMDIVDRF